MAAVHDKRIAFIGAGWVARTVWVPLLQQAGADVISVIDPAPSARDQLAPLLPEARFSHSLSAAALAGCDVAFICSPNVYHVEHALYALSQGLHVILEKPACFSRHDAERLIARSLESGCGLQVTGASSKRHDVSDMSAVVSTGDFGAIYCIDVSWRRKSGIPRPGSWFTREKTAIGGCGADIGWHLLEVALGLLNYPTVSAGLSQRVRVDGAPGNSRAAWRGEESATEDEELSVETQLFGCLMTESGAMIRISTAWASHQDSDTTEIVVYGQGGELALQCTFGFSADATAAQSLTLLKNAQRQQLPFQVEEKLAPYRTFVASAMELLGESNPATGPRGRLEQQKLRSLGSAMEVLYGGRTVAHGTQECSPCLSA
jgi:oxidoreductase